MDELLSIPGTRKQGCSTTALLRLRTGELDTDAAAKVRDHLAGCDPCRREMDRLDREEIAYKRDESYEKFRRAVEAKVGQVERRKWAGPVALAIAASITALIAIGPIRDASRARHKTELKGSSAMELYVGGAGASPRVAAPLEPLSAGERIRVAIHAQSEADKYVIVFSIDESGTVTPLYPESGISLDANPGAGSHLMPDSLELTGHGLEKVVAVFSQQPMQVESVLQAARSEFARAHTLEAMQPLPLHATESSQLLRKP